MKRTIKKGTVLALTLLMLMACIYAPLGRTEAAVMYNNMTSASMSCSVSSAGELSADLDAAGISGRTTRIKVQLYVEKRVLGLFWSKVDIGCTDNIWEDSTTSVTYSNTFSTHLPSTGKYRVTATFTVSGRGGADDVIVKTSTLTY